MPDDYVLCTSLDPQQHNKAGTPPQCIHPINGFQLPDILHTHIRHPKRVAMQDLYSYSKKVSFSVPVWPPDGGLYSQCSFASSHQLERFWCDSRQKPSRGLRPRSGN